MKKFVALFLLTIPLSLSAADLSVGVDLRDIDSFWCEDLRLDALLGIYSNDFNIIIPVRYGKRGNNMLNFLESGIVVEVKPFDGWNLLVQASFCKVGFLWGPLAPDEQLFFSAEGSVGWIIPIGRCWLKPLVTYRNGLTSDALASEAVKEIRQFSEWRLGLHFGMDI